MRTAREERDALRSCVMSYHLPKKTVRIALRHFCKYGDTDVFPHLPEIAFLDECEESVVAKLVSLDLDGYAPGSAFEALAPKSRYGFRIAHQLPVTDALLLLAAVIEIAPAIEATRAPSDSIEAFSYRVQL